MNFSEAIQSGFNNYVNFNGRAQRSAFWYWMLFAWLAGLAVVSILDMAIFGSDSFYAAEFDLHARHDPAEPRGRRGACTIPAVPAGGSLLWFLPIIGFIILLIWFIQQGRSRHQPIRAQSTRRVIAAYPALISRIGVVALEQIEQTEQRFPALACEHGIARHDELRVVAGGGEQMAMRFR